MRRPCDPLGAWPPDHTQCVVHRFVGLGNEPDSSHHLNLYFEPPLAPAVNPRDRRPGPTARRAPPRGAGTAMKKGINYLLARQTDGHWRDFELPVGTADSWVTAYVLHHLAAVPPRRGPESLDRAMADGLAWLVGNRTVGGGWGYRTAIEDDADSTALALIALRRQGCPLPEDALRFLGRCCLADGSVATFPPGHPEGGAWTKGTVDVTPIALEAMEPCLSGTAVDKARRFLCRRQQPDGTWPSYWWTTPLYATWTAASWLRPHGGIPRAQALAATLRGYCPRDVFENALLVLSAALLDGGARLAPSVRDFASSQNSDGSWSGAPKLRLTNPKVDAPWTGIDVGPCFADLDGIFTTATVIAALAELPP